MITIDQLNAFEKYLKSRQVEDDFRYGSEQERLDLLELLEKFMNVADVADELATKLIFRGRVPSGGAGEIKNGGQ